MYSGIQLLDLDSFCLSEMGLTYLAQQPWSCLFCQLVLQLCFTGKILCNPTSLKIQHQLQHVLKHSGDIYQDFKFGHTKASSGKWPTFNLTLLSGRDVSMS